jgi:KAP family P-loop domain
MPKSRRPLVYATVAQDREGVGATRELSAALASAGFDVFPGPAEEPFFSSSHSAEDHPSRDAFAAVVVVSPGALESKEMIAEIDALIGRASRDPSFRLFAMATESVAIDDVAESPLRPLVEIQFAEGEKLRERIDAIVRTLLETVEPEPTWRTEVQAGEALEPQAEVTLPSFSRAALRALSFAEQMLGNDAGDLARLRTAALLGALRASVVSGMGPTTGDVVRLVLDRQTGRDALETLAAAADAAGLKPVENREPDAMTVDGLMASRVGPLVEDAIAIHRLVGADGVDLRHVLATGVDRAVSVDALAELRITLSELRERWRPSIAERWPAESSAAWDAILAEPSTEFDLAGGVSRDAVDPTRGIPLAEDRLGVGPYVAMLATVIADSRTPEPLSIGLFGEWGSGKSYFMGLLREQVAQLSRYGDPYCRGVRQIGFNAWHYSDTNIWASLGDEIFEELAKVAEPVEELRRELREQHAESLQRRQELEAETEDARRETAQLRRELDKAREARSTSARDVVQALAESEDVQRDVAAAFHRLGIDDSDEQVRLLATEVRGTAADADALRIAFAGRRGRVLLALVLLLVVAVAALAAAAPAVGKWFAGGSVAAFVALLSAVAWLLARVRSAFRVVRAADAKAVRNAVEEPLRRLRTAEEQERELEARRDDAAGRVAELGRELAALSPGERTYGFLAERAASEDYRRYLGVISTVRKDFEQLVERLKDWRDHPDPDDGRPRIDRIVLYIDDLDRCSSRQVVEVLQAVHLLLALDLFVVVVGVDPRWLVRSLQNEYPAALTGDDEELPERWEASPHDYLEKIFNIPFALPRMSPGGFKQLLGSFAASPADGIHRPTTEGPAGSEEPLVPVNGGGLSPTSAPAVVGLEALSEAAAAIADEPEIEVRPLTDPELELLASLAPLVSTPREAKRLANLYRLLRSSRDLSPASRFLGDDDRPGEYQAVVVLLGLLSGHAWLLEDVLAAQPADNVLGGLVRRPSGSTWRQFVAGLEPKQQDGAWRNDVMGALDGRDVPSWQQLHTGLAKTTSLVQLQDLTVFQLWAPLVARFSFLLSPFVAAERTERSEQEVPA